MSGSRPAGEVGRGPLLVAVARMAPLVVQLAATPFVIGTLGASAYAVWALMMTTINLLMTADLGVVSIMQRYHGIARGREDPDAAGRVTATVLVVLGLVLVVALALGPAIGNAVAGLVDIAPALVGAARQVFAQTATIAVLQLIGLAFSGYLAAHERFATMAAVSIGARSVMVAGIVVVLVTGAGLRGLVVASYLDAATAVLLGVWVTRDHLRGQVRRPVHAHEARQMWAYAWRNQASALGFVAQRESDVLMAGVLLSSGALATVAAAAPLTAAASFAPVVLLTPLFSRLSVLAAGPSDQVVAAAYEAEHGWSRLALPYALLVLAALPPAAAVYIGPQIAEVGLVSAILAAGFLTSLASSVTAVLVRALGHPGIETRAYVGYVVVKIGLGVLLARLLGAPGLALSGVLAGLTLVLLLRIGARREVGMRGGGPSWPTVAVAVPVATAVAAASWAVEQAAWARPIQLVVIGIVAALGAVAALAADRRTARRAA
jgi:O-antigen/teichoic acid export membrane protein